MSIKDTYEKFNSCIIDNKLECSEDDLNEFMMCGILLPAGNSYITRNGLTLEVNTYKPKVLNFDINLNGLISNCIQLSKDSSEKRIFCMTDKTYSKYKENGLIVEKQNKEYYRDFEKELWLVNIF